MASEVDKKSFTINWQIKNFNSWSPDYWQWIITPSFCVENRTWILALLATDSEYVQLTLRVNEISTEDIGLDYCFSLSSDYSSLPTIRVSSHTFSSRYPSAPRLLVPKTNLFLRVKDKLIFPNNLTIQCKLWKKQGSFLEDAECSAITELQEELISFGATVRNVRTLIEHSAFGKKQAILTGSAGTESPDFCLNIVMTNDETIFVEVTLFYYTDICWCKGILYLLDHTGKETECGRGEYIFLKNAPTQVWKIPLIISKANLRQFTEQYLPQDHLPLQIEIFTEKMIRKITKTKYATNLPKLTTQSDSSLRNNTDEAKENRQFKLTVTEDLLSLFSTDILSDVKLKTATESFPAHKNILSARSPVFKAMFTSNLKEHIGTCVEIEDLDADTVRRFLVFLYGGDLQDLDLESAWKLYFASVKYEVLSLKQKCSRFLQENLNPSICCQVLVLADTHSDAGLKQATQEYIAHHEKDVFETEQWKYFEKTYQNLVVDIFRTMHQRSWRYS